MCLECLLLDTVLVVDLITFKSFDIAMFVDFSSLLFSYVCQFSLSQEKNVLVYGLMILTRDTTFITLACWSYLKNFCQENFILTKIKLTITVLKLYAFWNFHDKIWVLLIWWGFFLCCTAYGSGKIKVKLCVLECYLSKYEFLKEWYKMSSVPQFQLSRKKMQKKCKA